MSKGDGYLFQRPNSNNWYLGYTVNGENRQMSAKTDDKEIAQKKLRALVGDAAQGIEHLNKADRVTLRDLIDALEVDYSANGNRSVRMLARFEQHTTSFFGEKTKLSKVNKTRIQQYIEHRRTQLLKKAGE